MDWQIPTKGQDGSIKIPGKWLQIHYYEAFTTLFRIENALRILVYITLKNQFKDKWATQSISSEEGEGSIQSIANKRRAQAGTFGYLGYPVSSPLLYLTTGELVRLITSEAYWKYFAANFQGAKNIVTTKFDEINSVRNALAHFRPIRQDDVDTIKQSSKHILTSVEQTLFAMLTCRDTVPTNTPDQWYTDFKTLGTSHTRLGFAQSTDEQWLRINLAYAGPVLSHFSIVPGFHSYSVLSLSAPAILRHSTTLTSLVTYVTESLGYAPIREDDELKVIAKTVSLGFMRSVLEENHAAIKEELETVLGVISQETELIQQDNLARGKLVRAVATSGTVPAGTPYGLVEQEPLRSGVGEGDPAEWWGEIEVYAPDVISAIHRYPWMPADIAALQFPG